MVPGEAPVSYYLLCADVCAVVGLCSVWVSREPVRFVAL